MTCSTLRLSVLVCLALALAACSGDLANHTLDGGAMAPTDASVPSTDGIVPPDPVPDAGVPMPGCLVPTAPCTDTAMCCDGTCGMTTLGMVCCGNEGASCATADGSDCCGDLLCVGGHCASSMCLGPTAACTATSECCDGRSCGHTSLGQVCCGNEGASCATADGSDCCGDLLCVGGHCTGGGGSCGPTLTYYPVRAEHNNGYDSTAGTRSSWTCEDANSNSDFVAGDHLGNDIWADEGAAVVATVSGTLRYVAFSDYSGNKLTIVDDCGWYHFYCHLQGFGPGITPGSADGTHVSAGQVVGYVGRTGTASHGVVHLHYSIYPHDSYDSGIDPWPALHAVEHGVCSIP